MKKLVALLLLAVIAFPSFSEASAIKSIKITETTPVFDEKQKVAVFQKGTSHTVMKESDLYYYTVIGNDEVKFSKKKGKVTKEQPESWKGAHPVRAKTSTYVQIVDRPTKNATIVGQIQPNMTIQVQRLKGDYFPIIMGGKTGYIHKNQLHIQAGIPVLMYHDILRTKTDDNTSTLEIEKFKKQMDYLKNNGWTTITPQQLEQWVAKKTTLPKKSVLITFDDGYQSTIDLAYPILKAHGFQATSFLITSRINRPNTVSELGMIQTQDVFSYQSHTHAFHMFNSQTNTSLLQHETESAIFHDLEQANSSIEEILGYNYRVTTLAYPYGKRGPEAISALQSVGLTSAYTIDEGNVFQGDPLFELKRQRVHSSMTLQNFADKLEGK
ncbi:polysaccharide deacetylase family protein [Sporosarcina sp. YIM B06819]|uniref:polysaccharide deacetylase family protein n=1 Tax=Sporosarcina sp. YIM B06819 TaxID=3081769 RepID=UPI00298BECF8|nr:polysaccharide deacetylase family protein [Sporosarcina sp. YIM B06819]